MTSAREQIDFDVVFVGGGPACLAGAIRLMQLAGERGLTPEVALVEKGAEIGAHALSGAVLNPIALQELIPDYIARGCPIEATVRGDEFYFLTRDKAYRLPLVPRYMHNTGFQIVSLARLTRWLGKIAEELGVNIFPGFSGSQVLYADDGRRVTGVRTGDQGLDKNGTPKGNFEPGIDLHARVTVFGEGARGSLMKSITEKLGLAAGKMPQVYETGIKEVIQLPEGHYFTTSDGNDIHTFGYPLGMKTPGGGFIYEMSDNRVAIGFLVGLGYENPFLDPYAEFIKFKRHPLVATIIRDGKVIEQGARTVSTGGYYTMPRLAADGALFVGGAAAIQNTPGLKGIHVSMKSGMLAAEAALAAVASGDPSAQTLALYPRRLEESWLKTEIYEGRNFAQALAKKMPAKLIHLGAQYVSGGRGLIDPLRHREDYRTLKPACKGQALTPQADAKPLYDGVLYVDKLTGVYLSKTLHREDEPCHLIVPDTRLCVTTCYETYANPCTRFCPAQVYEMETDEKTGRRHLKLNPSNCLHCKTCDIKDPYRNITWTCPEGGEGPSYSTV
ncbi:MAG: electron transfer flavoprotein-ubiquinone oxidoreductase [Desulfobacterales bacterium]|jgi:electron-transferring-flavoprotein dehydrogenase|nr:electron transfer flavoprotein-ubiquinone oxidoreductase [Desulfobacterales bacterium]